MYYRETGQRTGSYAEDRRMLPVREDRWAMWGFLAFMFIIIPWFANDYMLSAIFIPMMVLSMASLGLNIAMELLSALIFCNTPKSSKIQKPRPDVAATKSLS